jgi:hypothetical protein
LPFDTLQESNMPPSSPLQKHLRMIRQSVTAIERAVSKLTASLDGGLARPVRTGRRLKLSPKRRAALKLHGRYLGHIRQLKPAQRAKVKAVKAKKGYHAAIALAQRLAR